MSLHVNSVALRDNSELVLKVGFGVCTVATLAPAVQAIIKISITILNPVLWVTYLVSLPYEGMTVVNMHYDELSTLLQLTVKVGRTLFIDDYAPHIWAGAIGIYLCARAVAYLSTPKTTAA